MEKIYLSGRNLTTLLQKLNGVRDGELSTCTIIKNDSAHPLYAQTVRRVAVKAVETEDRYWQGVSPRLHLSRPTLTTLQDQLQDSSASAIDIDIDGMQVFAVSDEKFYAAQNQENLASVGDLASAFIRSRGKQN